MFKIYLLNASNYPTEIYNDLNVFDPIVLEPELEYNGENGILIGKLSFKLRNPDFEYDLRLLHNTVIVTQVINGVEIVIFRGRPLLRDDDNYNDQDYTFEGILAGLNDTLQAPSNKEIGGRLYEHFVTIIDWHNNQVRSISNNRLIDYSKISRTDSKSHMYTISGRDPIHIFIEKMVKYTRFRASTMDHIKTQYVDAHGGYFYLEDEPLTYDSSGCVVLHNYLKYIDIYNPDQTHINSQHIEFGKNLISVKRSASADDFATVLVPLGKQLTDIDKAWPYYQSVENNKLRKIVSSPDDAEIINYNSTGASIDSETGKEYRNLSSAYVLPRDVDVNPGDVFYLTTYLEGVSTDKGIATYAILDRATGSKVYAMGTSVRNSKESGGAVTVKNVVLKDERIEIPDIEEQGVDLKLRTAYMISANDPNGGFVLKKFNKNYQEDNVTIMSADPLTTGTIRKTGQYPVGRDVYPDATDTPTAPETYEQSKRIVNKDLFDVFGSIERSIEFSDYGIDEVNDIVGVASKELEKMGEDLEIEIEAADMSYIDDSQEPFRPYDLVPVKSDPHGLDMMLPIVKMTLPLADPAAATYILQNDVHLSPESKKYISQMVSSPGANMQKNQTVVIYSGGGSSSGGGGEQGPPGPAGADGYSPTVAVSAITGGHAVTITDTNGDHSFNVMDGADGVSPSVTVTSITGGHRVTITDATGTNTFDVMDGEDSSGIGNVVTMTKTNGVWQLDSPGMWRTLWNHFSEEILLVAYDGNNVRNMYKVGLEYTNADSIDSVDIYFSDQRYNGRISEGNVFKLTVPETGNGTITVITGADIPQSSGGSGSTPYEIPITATSSSWSTNKQGDEIYANADNCVLVVNGTYLDVLSSEKYTENGSQYVRIVGIEYDVLNSNDYEFYAYEIIAENSNVGSPIITRRHYDSDFFIRHHVFFYNENTRAITNTAGVAATGSDIDNILTAGFSSVYIIGELMENGDMTYYFYKPMTDISVGSNTGFIKFSRTTDTGIEILTIPANSSTATKTTTPLGGAVLYTAQSLNASQKTQARANIGAVAAVDGKGLSTNDYTTAEKNKLAGIQSGAEANVQPDWNQTDTSADDFIKNKPRIPDRTSDLVNDSGFITSADAGVMTINGHSGPTVTLVTSDLTNDSGYITIDDVPQEVPVPSASENGMVLGVENGQYVFTRMTGGISDVYMDGASIVQSGTTIATIPKANTTRFGVVKLYDGSDSTSTSLVPTANALRSVAQRVGNLETRSENWRTETQIKALIAEAILDHQNELATLDRYANVVVAQSKDDIINLLFVPSASTVFNTNPYKYGYVIYNTKTISGGGSSADTYEFPRGYIICVYKGNAYNVTIEGVYYWFTYVFLKYPTFEPLGAYNEEEIEFYSRSIISGTALEQAQQDAKDFIAYLESQP